MPSRRRARTFRDHALALYPFCQWCGRPLTAATATADHLTARAYGGGDDWANLCLACARCNTARGDRPADRPPHGPDWAGAAWWVAWTRYPGGRWRPTLRALTPAECERRALRLFPACEVAVLPPGTAPL